MGKREHFKECNRNLRLTWRSIYITHQVILVKFLVAMVVSVLPRKGNIGGNILTGLFGLILILTTICMYILSEKVRPVMQDFRLIRERSHHFVN